MMGLGLLLAGCQLFEPRQAAQPIPALTPGEICAGCGPIDSSTFTQCVAYQESRSPGPSVPPYRLDQYNNRVDAEGYRVDGTGHRMPLQSPYYSPTGR